MSLGEGNAEFLVRVQHTEDEQRRQRRHSDSEASDDAQGVQGVQGVQDVQDDASNTASSHERQQHAACSPTTETIDQVVRRAFWDDFARRLQANDTEQLRALLTELVDAIAKLTPNRADLHQELHAEVDADLIAQMVRHQCLDEAEFHSITAALVRRVAGLIAPVRSVALLDWHPVWLASKHVDHDCDHTNNSQTMSASMVRMLPAFFEKLHTEVGLAQRACEQIRSQICKTDG
jgi:hypothetical protein